MDVLTDQYRNCETEIEFSRYAQFIDRVVENVLIEKDNSLILDFDNSATLTVNGDPAEDDYTDILWSLIETKNWQPLFDCYSSHRELADVPIPKTKFSQRDLLKHIDKYMKLQTAVLKEFAEKEPYILRQDTFCKRESAARSISTARAGIFSDTELDFPSLNSKVKSNSIFTPTLTSLKNWTSGGSFAI
mgnify:CR=1 FL=1